MADVDDLGGFGVGAGQLELGGLDQAAVLAGDAHGAAALPVQLGDDFLVDPSAEHHFHHVHGGRVGHPHPVDEAGGNVELLEQCTDLRAAAVHDHRVHADQLHERHIPGEGGLQVLVHHGVAAVLDDDGPSLELADVRQRLGQDGGDVLRLVFRNGHGRSPETERRVHGVELRLEGLLDPLQRRLAVGLEAERQHGAGVGGADQAPAVGIVHTQAVYIRKCAVAEVGPAGERLDDLELAGLGGSDLQFGRGTGFRKPAEHRVDAAVVRLPGAENLQQACRGVERVVEAVPALAEADVAAELAAEQGAGLSASFALMWEWPVRLMMGSPPSRRTRAPRRWLHLTS